MRVRVLEDRNRLGKCSALNHYTEYLLTQREDPADTSDLPCPLCSNPMNLTIIESSLHRISFVKSLLYTNNPHCCFSLPSKERFPCATNGKTWELRPLWWIIGMGLSLNASSLVRSRGSRLGLSQPILTT